MAEVYNTILLGYAWEQSLLLPAGSVLPDDTFRADFRPLSRLEVLFLKLSTGAGISVQTGVTVEGSTYDAVTLSLTKRQAGRFKQGQQLGPVMTGLTLVRGGVESPYADALVIPVERYVTEPTNG